MANTSISKQPQHRDEVWAATGENNWKLSQTNLNFFVRTFKLAGKHAKADYGSVLSKIRSLGSTRKCIIIHRLAAMISQEVVAKEACLCKKIVRRWLAGRARSNQICLR